MFVDISHEFTVYLIQIRIWNDINEIMALILFRSNSKNILLNNKIVVVQYLLIFKENSIN